MILYQTLVNRGNYDEVLSNGPFECTRTDAWLTSGYYFWDSHIELAHWWGNCFKKEYLITSVKLSSLDDIFDLYNNHEHRNELREVIESLVKEGELPKNVKLPELLIYLKKNGIFTYKGIRMEGKNSFNSWNSEIWGRLKILIKGKAYVDLLPAIQVCIFDTSVLEMETYEIVHPIEIKKISSEELF